VNDDRNDDARFDAGNGDGERRDAAPAAKTPAEDLSMRVRAHARECEECAVQPVVLDRVGALFARMPEPPPAPSLSGRVLAAAVPLLAANAAAAYRRRLVSGVALSLAPFPLLVFFNLYLLREAYALLASWLPVEFAVWLVVGYAAMLLLICALTYASLPVLIARARSGAVVAREPLPDSAYA